MLRLLIFLPVCLFFAPAYPETVTDEGPFLPESPLAAASAEEEPLPVADPVAFLEKCLERFDQEGIQGYSCVMHKQERIEGKLQPSEDVELFVRTQPYSVLMRWLRGHYVELAGKYLSGAFDLRDQ